MCFTESLRREPPRPTPRYNPDVVYPATGDQLARDVQKAGGDRASNDSRQDSGDPTSANNRLDTRHPTSNESLPLTTGPARRAVRSGKFYPWTR